MRLTLLVKKHYGNCICLTTNSPKTCTFICYMLGKNMIDPHSCSEVAYSIPLSNKRWYFTRTHSCSMLLIRNFIELKVETAFELTQQCRSTLPAQVVWQNSSGVYPLNTWTHTDYWYMNRNPRSQYTNTRTHYHLTLWKNSASRNERMCTEHNENGTHASFRRPCEEIQVMVCYGLQRRAVINMGIKNQNFPAFPAALVFTVQMYPSINPSLGAHDVGVVCGVWQWRIVAVVQKAVSPAAVADEKQCRQED